MPRLDDVELCTTGRTFVAERLPDELVMLAERRDVSLFAWCRGCLLDVFHEDAPLCESARGDRRGAYACLHLRGGSCYLWSSLKCDADVWSITSAPVRQYMNHPTSPVGMLAVPPTTNGL